MPIKVKNEAGEDVEVLTAAEQTEMITGAVTKASKKLSSDLTTALTASIGESVAQSLTAFEARREEAAQAAEAERAAAAAAGGGGSGSKAEPASIENSPAFRSLMKKFEASEKAREVSDAKAKAEAAKAKDTSLRQRIAEELDKAGFDSKARHLALGHLVDSARLARYSDDGETILFKDTDGSDVDLPTGLKSFAQTDDGKRFMPTSGASGTGDRSRFVAPTQKPNGKIDAGELGRMVLNTMVGLPQSGG